MRREPGFHVIGEWNPHHIIYAWLGFSPSSSPWQHSLQRLRNVRHKRGITGLPFYALTVARFIQHGQSSMFVFASFHVCFHNCRKLFIKWCALQLTFEAKCWQHWRNVLIHSYYNWFLCFLSSVSFIRRLCILWWVFHCSNNLGFSGFS